MAPFSSNGEGKIIFAGSHAPHPGGKGPGRQERRIVEAIDFIHGEPFEQPVIDHGLGTPARFFCRLKDKADRAIEIFPIRQQFGRSQQHHRMAVMTVAMHFPRTQGDMVMAAPFCDIQSIHIRPDADTASAIPAPESAYHSGPADAFFDLDPPGPHLFCSQLGSRFLLKGCFRMLMEIMTPSRQLFFEIHFNSLSHPLSYVPIISRTTSKNTLAPLMQAWSGVYSAGLWLMPLTLGTKIMAVGQIRAIIWAS